MRLRCPRGAIRFGFGLFGRLTRSLFVAKGVVCCAFADSPRTCVASATAA